MLKTQRNIDHLCVSRKHASIVEKQSYFWQSYFLNYIIFEKNLMKKILFPLDA